MSEGPPLRELNKTRLLVCGSRTWSNQDLIAKHLFSFLDSSSYVVLVHGGARGADTIAAAEARKLGFEEEEHLAAWALHGRGAGLYRNEEMAVLGADHCLAFWDGKSRGTADMIERAKAHGIPVTIIYETDPDDTR